MPPVTVADRDAGDAHRRRGSARPAVAQVLHAAALQIAQPRIDPDQVRRSVEHTIGRSVRRVDDRQHHLHEDVADGARAGLARLGRHQRTRDAGRQELLVGRRAPLGADELPPADPLVLAEPALRARGQDLPDARAEERQIVRREAGDRTEGEEDVAQHRAGIGRRSAGRSPESRMWACRIA